MIFYAYENWRAHGHRVTVHAANCPFCNDGCGVRGGTRSDNGRWHELGEFFSPEEALECASRITPALTARLCGACRLKPRPVPRTAGEQSPRIFHGS